MISWTRPEDPRSSSLAWWTRWYFSASPLFPRELRSRCGCLLSGGCRCCNESLPGVYPPLTWTVENTDRDHFDPGFIHWLRCPPLPKVRTDLRCFSSLGSPPTIARSILFSLATARRDYHAVEFVRRHFPEEGPGAYGFCHEAGEAQEQVERRSTQKPSRSLPPKVG